MWRSLLIALAALLAAPAAVQACAKLPAGFADEAPVESRGAEHIRTTLCVRVGGRRIVLRRVLAGVTPSGRPRGTVIGAAAAAGRRVAWIESASARAARRRRARGAHRPRRARDAAEAVRRLARQLRPGAGPRRAAHRARRPRLARALLRQRLLARRPRPSARAAAHGRHRHGAAVARRPHDPGLARRGGLRITCSRRVPVAARGAPPTTRSRRTAR